MSEPSEALLIVKTQQALTTKQREDMMAALFRITEPMGMKALVLDQCLDAGIHSDIRPLIEQQLEEQRKTNELLVMLIEAMAEADGDMDAEPTRYIDGSPVR